MGEDSQGVGVAAKWPPVIVMVISQVAMGSSFTCEESP